MNVFKKKQLVRVLEAIGKASNMPYIKIKEKIDKLVEIEDYETIINNLIFDVYTTFGESQVDLCDYSLDMIKTIGSKYYNSIDDMKKYAKDRINKNINNENISLEENHELIYKTLKDMCNIFNENNIDYYIIGGISMVLETTKIFTRYHNEIVRAHV